MIVAVYKVFQIFLSTPSARRATIEQPSRMKPSSFLSTPSARRATRKIKPFVKVGKLFLSTPSARRATISAMQSGSAASISIHALCEEGDPSERDAMYTTPMRSISIHALCEEGDFLRLEVDNWQKISIHALCEEGDTKISPNRTSPRKFLSTPSARRAT